MDAPLANALGDILEACERRTGALRSAAARCSQPALRAGITARADAYDSARAELLALLAQQRREACAGPDEPVPPELRTAPAAAAAAATVVWSGASELAVLETWERVETAARDAFARALQAAPAPPLRAFLAAQHAAAEASLARVRSCVREAVQRQCEGVRRVAGEPVRSRAG